MRQPSLQLFAEALEFALQAHTGQKRKGDGSSYITHPLQVMFYINKFKKSTNPWLLAIVAVLHDTVEDCNISIAEIAQRFGYNVASLVQELTLDKSEYKVFGKKQYLTMTILKMSSYALAIKLCDRLHNIEDMKTMDEKFISSYIAETKYILKGLKARKLSKTHKRLMKMIKKAMKQY